MDKDELRRYYLQLRQQLDTAALGPRACAALAGFLRSRRARHVMIYLPFRNELSPLALLELYPEAEYYLPRASAGFLTVHPYHSPRERHRYGFEQPAIGAPAVGEETLEAVVVPGLAFDRHGFRLGYGGGYYDRFLAELPPGVFTVGLAPRELVVDELPRDPWDVPVGWLATEEGVRASEPL
ncbi:5-formyltetrahydrofolate cyclo-ligase [Oceanithermus sp.]